MSLHNLSAIAIEINCEFPVHPKFIIRPDLNSFVIGCCVSVLGAPDLQQTLFHQKHHPSNSECTTENVAVILSMSVHQTKTTHKELGHVTVGQSHAVE